MKRLPVLVLFCLSLVMVVGCKKLFKRGIPDAAVTVAEPEAVDTAEATGDTDIAQPADTTKPKTVATAKALAKTTAPDAAVAAVAVADAGAAKTATADAGGAAAATGDAIAFSGGQTWSGSYVCTQGKTDVALHISKVTGNNVEAVFDFKVPNAPNGKYKMSGVYAPATRHLRLNAGEWIVQPAGYGTVPVDATVSADGKAYTGKVVASGCSDFSVHR
ncbi:MAG: hypothetical protein JWM74_1715 [Myxococcaceae bacterium]|nr:hypothetical protein [Myxococcaceae bacterium]